MSRIRLSNPVPLEAAIQLRRHMLNITKASGHYNLTVEKTGITVPGKNLQNSSVTSTKRLEINTMWDLDRNVDRSGVRTNGLKLWHSTCFLNCFLYTASENDPMDEQRQRAFLMADLEKYFFPAPGAAHSHGLEAPWTLPTANGNEVIRYMEILAVNCDADFQKKPIIRVDIELLLVWAHIQGDLYFPA